MTKEKLFEKYKINNNHSVWDNVMDDWISIELHRIMHDGEIPKPDDMNLLYVLEFLDKVRSGEINSDNICRNLFLNAKRMVYHHSDEILKQLDESEIKSDKKDFYIVFSFYFMDSKGWKVKEFYGTREDAYSRGCVLAHRYKEQYRQCNFTLVKNKKEKDVYNVVVHAWFSDSLGWKTDTANSRQTAYNLARSLEYERESTFSHCDSIVIPPWKEKVKTIKRGKVFIRFLKRLFT